METDKLWKHFYISPSRKCFHTAAEIADYIVSETVSFRSVFLIYSSSKHTAYITILRCAIILFHEELHNRKLANLFKKYGY